MGVTSPLPSDQPTSAENEELVYAAAVLILSEDLYPRKLEIIREYVQNASDALDEFISIAEYIEDRSEPQMKISIQGRSLLIFDNGIGMDNEGIAKLKRIAYSEKKAGEEAGYKGIGRLAGVAVADKLKISSTSYGDSKLHHFEFRAKDMREDISDKKKSGLQEPATQVINRHTSMWWTDIDPEEHYTLVELRDIRESYEELLDLDQIKNYVSDVGPVDFAPAQQFTYGPVISRNLRNNVPDYSPKNVYISGPSGERQRIYRPYNNEMCMAEPSFLEIINPQNPEELLAFCWYAPKGREMLGKIRPQGRIFSVDTESRKDNQLAGLVYKLFGFTIGDRTLPQRTLWTTTLQRALWFTGEIHIIDKSVMPTTDRSNFVENESRKRLYGEALKIPRKLNKAAQQISDDRKAHDDSEKFKKKFQGYQDKLATGQIESGQLKTIKEEINECLGVLRTRASKCKDSEIIDYEKEVSDLGKKVQETLKNPKLLKSAGTLADIATELKMPPKVKKVFTIMMGTLATYFKEDRDEYYRIAAEIYSSLRKKY